MMNNAAVRAVGKKAAATAPSEDGPWMGLDQSSPSLMDESMYLPTDHR